MEMANKTHQGMLMDENDAVDTTRHSRWAMKEAARRESIGSVVIESSSSSSSSTDTLEDTSSSACSSSPSEGPPFELSELMAQLPIRRGLSNYYDGKSQSFGSLASVGSLEDLAKKESPYGRRKRIKYSSGILNCHRYNRPKATIAKKSLSSSFGRRASFPRTCRPSFGIGSY